MAKFYVVSDVHGFYDEMRKALDEAGFDPNDENSWLISLGDEIDRGNKPAEVIDYLMSLPRAIFIKGNHQSLMEDLVQRKYAYKYDWSNGTMGSVICLAPDAKTTDESFEIAYSKVKPFFDKTLNYFETKNYIFVHSFVPLKCDTDFPPYHLRSKYYAKMENWREAKNWMWEDARWGNPFELAEQGLLPDKTLVFGHFHTSWPRHEYEGKLEWTAQADFSPYYGNGYIGIDACVSHSGKINVLVLEDEFMEGTV